MSFCLILGSQNKLIRRCKLMLGNTRSREDEIYSESKELVSCTYGLNITGFNEAKSFPDEQKPNSSQPCCCMVQKLERDIKYM